MKKTLLAICSTVMLIGVAWKQEDGKWKMYRDIFNSDNSAAPAK